MKMKRYNKVLILVLVVGIFFSGAAVGTSVNGLFEGFSIINVIVNGKKVEGDVPAINFKGRTMVPVRFVSEELGATVEWEGETASAIITKKPDEIISSEYTQEDIDELKFYNKVAEHYKWIGDLADDLVFMYYEFEILANNIIYQNNINYLETLKENYNARIDRYNARVDPTQNIIIEAEDREVNLSDMNDILNSYLEGMDFYDQAFDSLMEYYYTKEPSHYKTYTDKCVQAVNSIRSKTTIFASRYHEYFYKIQLYK